MLLWWKGHGDWLGSGKMTQQQLYPHNSDQTGLHLQSQSNPSTDCDCHHHRGTRACLRLTFTTCSALHLIHNKCIRLSTFIVPQAQCTEAMGQAAIPEVPPPCCLWQDQVLRAFQKCHQAHHPHRQHGLCQVGQTGRGEVGHGHGRLCAAGYSTTSPYLFLLTSVAAPSLSSALGRFSATRKYKFPGPPTTLMGLPSVGKEPQSLGEARKASSSWPSFGSSRYVWEKAASTNENCPAAAVLMPLQFCPPYWAANPSTPRLLSPSLTFSFRFQQMSLLCWLL